MLVGNQVQVKRKALDLYKLVDDSLKQKYLRILLTYPCFKRRDLAWPFLKYSEGIAGLKLFGAYFFSSRFL